MYKHVHAHTHTPHQAQGRHDSLYEEYALAQQQLEQVIVVNSLRMDQLFSDKQSDSGSVSVVMVDLSLAAGGGLQSQDC